MHSSLGARAESLPLMMAGTEMVMVAARAVMMGVGNGGDDSGDDDDRAGL